MRLDPGLARTLLPRVDPGRVRSGRAVGLRDGAVLALVATGLTAAQLAAFRSNCRQAFKGGSYTLVGATVQVTGAAAYDLFARAETAAEATFPILKGHA